MIHRTVSASGGCCIRSCEWQTGYQWHCLGNWLLTIIHLLCATWFQLRGDRRRQFRRRVCIDCLERMYCKTNTDVELNNSRLTTHRLQQLQLLHSCCMWSCSYTSIVQHSFHPFIIKKLHTVHESVPHSPLQSLLFHTGIQQLYLQAS